jgi:hypothetical protein
MITELTCFTNLVRLWLSSTPLLQTAQACNPSLTFEATAIVQKLLQKTISSCSVEDEGVSKLVIDDTDGDVQISFSAMLAEGLRFAWRQRLDRQNDPSRIFMEQVINPLISGLNRIPGLERDPNPPSPAELPEHPRCRKRRPPPWTAKSHEPQEERNGTRKRTRQGRSVRSHCISHLKRVVYCQKMPVI